MAEQRLRILLEDASAGVSGPNLAAAALDGARRRRMRRRLASVAAVSAVVVALSAALVTSPELSGKGKPVPAGPIKSDQTPTSSPSPARVPRTVADLPHGDLPELPYIIKDTLFLGDVSTALPDSFAWLRVGGDSQQPGPGGASILTWAAQSETASPLRLVRADGRKTTVLDRDASSPPGVSVDGRLAAWQTSSSGRAEAVLWNLSTMQEVARKTFPFTPSCCDNPFNVVGVDAAGRVFGTGGGKTWMWDSRTGSLHLVRGLGQMPYIEEATTDGVVASLEPKSKQDSPMAVVGRVDATGMFLEQVRVRGVFGTVSWDGSQLAYLVGEKSLRVRDLATGRDRVMNLPATTYIDDLIWETSKTVLVVVQSPNKGPDAWVRCVAETGACELATLLRGSYMVARR